MAQAPAQNQNDPRYRTQITLNRLKEEIDRLHADITDVDEPEFKATAKTAAPYRFRGVDVAREPAGGTEIGGCADRGRQHRP